MFYIYIISLFISTAIYVYKLNKKIKKLAELELDNVLKENKNKVLQKQLKKQIKYNSNLRKKLDFSRKEAEELYLGWTANFSRTNTEISPDSVYDKYHDL